MDKYKETFQTWNKVAQRYQDLFMDLTIYDDSYDVFVRMLPSNKHTYLLELGCGPGNITKYLLQKRPDLSILATDVAPQMIELARKNSPKADFQIMDCRAISSLQRQFDAIVCGFVLPYLSTTDVDQLLSDSYLRLSNKGVIYLSFVDGNIEQSGFISGSSGDRTYFYYHPIDQLKAQLKNKGFAVIKEIHIPYTKANKENEIHSVLIGQKST